MLKYFDTHSHLNFSQYDDDRDQVLARMREHGVWTITVGTGLKTSRESVALAEKESDVVYGATIGIHPTDTDETFDANEFKKLMSPKVVGVGECGLDYFRGSRDELKPKQEKNFEAQIAFAVEHDLPLMLHVRPSKGSEDAHEDAIKTLKSAQKIHGDKVRGNSHFFTSSVDIAKKYWDMGFTTAVPGVVTFAPELEETVREAPLEMLLSETDAPYAAPEPYRGGRNEPTYVTEVVKKIAEIRGKDIGTVQETLVQNALRVFGRKS